MFSYDVIPNENPDDGRRRTELPNRFLYQSGISRSRKRSVKSIGRAIKQMISVMKLTSIKKPGTDIKTTTPIEIDNTHTDGDVNFEPLDVSHAEDTC